MLYRVRDPIVTRQEQGIAAISDTTIRGEYALRVAINNHRTSRSDLDFFTAETLRLGADIGPQDQIQRRVARL